MEFKVTKALNEDARAIRVEVFVDEQGFLEEFDEIDDRAFHIVLYKDKKAVATGRIFEKYNKIYKFGRIAVKKDFRQQNFGRKIMHKLEQVAKENGAIKIELSSQYHAKEFYEKCGYTVVGDVYLEENSPHIMMEKVLI